MNDGADTKGHELCLGITNGQKKKRVRKKGRCSKAEYGMREEPKGGEWAGRHLRGVRER